MQKKFEYGDDYNEWWECKRKTPYTKWSAENRIRIVKGRGDDPRAHLLRAYRCGRCQFYHVGHRGAENKRLELKTTS